MLDNFVNYAKARKLPNDIYETEDIKEHTDKLLENLMLLEQLYGNDIEIMIGKHIWEDLKVCALFHDLGKYSPQFQNKLRRILNLVPSKLGLEFQKEIPHNFLSVAFLPENIAPASPIFYAIINHHSRPLDFEETYLKKILALLKPQLAQMKWIEQHGYQVDFWDGYYPYLGHDGRTIFDNIRKQQYYIALKGLLHRLDYSSSAGVDVEVTRIENAHEFMINALKKKARNEGWHFSSLKPFQTEAKEYRKSNVILAASTGMGKTEFAVNWIGDDKGFYVLPLRVSVDTMHDRMCDMFGSEKVGLLHGDSFFRMLDTGNEEDETITDQEIQGFLRKTTLARQLSMPLTVTTADQLFTAVFKWKGYEQIYSTLMYSKIVLDEPQAFSPEILATVVTALQEISSLGGKFCIMSATLHPFVTQELRKHVEVVQLKPVYNTELKHKLCLADTDICGLIRDIESKYKDEKKILVICNTVKRSQEVYELLQHLGDVHLLHSGFVVRDRALKERQIKEDYKKNNGVIWVSTQLIEASLDIDYDILFTELPTIDALIQRMGRIFRRTGRVLRQSDPANIIIASKDPSDEGYIYAAELVGFTREVLSRVNGDIMPEELKAELMEEVFSPDRVKATDLYKKFLRYRNLLVNGFEAETKKEAQDVFRNISNITVIPASVYEANLNLIDSCVAKLESTRIPFVEKMLATKEMRGFTVDIPLYRAKGKGLGRLDNKGRFLLIDLPYGKLGVDFRKGSQLEYLSNFM